MEQYLYLSALLLASIAIAHSYLGERYILIRLFKRDDLPKLFGSCDFTRFTLRFAWHLTSIAWLGFGAILVTLANPDTELSTVGTIVGLTFLVHFLVAIVGSKGRHLSWLIFLIVGILSIYATNT
ncbi:MAG: hypothetical protein ACI8XX_001606 [Polaribacter sp.]|jgi:hypothetical protein